MRIVALQPVPACEAYTVIRFVALVPCCLLAFSPFRLFFFLCFSFLLFSSFLLLFLGCFFLRCVLLAAFSHIALRFALLSLCSCLLRCTRVFQIVLFCFLLRFLLRFFFLLFFLGVLVLDRVLLAARWRRVWTPLRASSRELTIFQNAFFRFPSFPSYD